MVFLFFTALHWLTFSSHQIVTYCNTMVCAVFPEVASRKFPEVTRRFINLVMIFIMWILALRLMMQKIIWRVDAVDDIDVEKTEVDELPPGHQTETLSEDVAKADGGPGGVVHWKSWRVVQWFSLVQIGTFWWSGKVWYRVVQSGVEWCSLVQNVTVWYGMVRCGTEQNIMVQSGTVWYRMVQSGT